MLEKVLIQAARLEDAEKINAFGKKSFINTYGPYNTARNMDLYLTKYFGLDKLKSEITNPDTCILLAWLDQQIIGYTYLEKQTLPHKNTKVIRMNRIYVDQKFQKKKIGSQLMQIAIKYVKDQSIDLLILGVWEKNTNALTFYQKWGFQPFGEEIFMLGEDAQRDILLKKQIY